MERQLTLTTNSKKLLLKSAGLKIRKFHAPAFTLID